MPEMTDQVCLPVIVASVVVGVVVRVAIASGRTVVTAVVVVSLEVESVLKLG